MKKIPTIGASLAILAALGWGVHEWASTLLYRLEPCDKPCRWVEKKGYSGCSPISVGLEVKTTPQPTGGVEAVWYRATIKNESCEILGLSPEFLESNDHYLLNAGKIKESLGTFPVVYDAEGRALKAFDGSPSDGIGRFETTIHPYKHDSSAHATFISNRYSDDLLILSPGQSIATSPSILAPYREKFMDFHTRGLLATALVPEPIAMPDAAKHYAVPPPGFRKLTEYDITRSGIFTAEIFFNEQILTHLRYHHETYPKWLRQILWFCVIGKPAGDFFSSYFSQVKTKSNLVRFEIR